MDPPPQSGLGGAGAAPGRRQSSTAVGDILPDQRLRRPSAFSSTSAHGPLTPDPSFRRHQSALMLAQGPQGLLPREVTAALLNLSGLSHSASTAQTGSLRRGSPGSMAPSRQVSMPPQASVLGDSAPVPDAIPVSLTPRARSQRDNSAAPRPGGEVTYVVPDGDPGDTMATGESPGAGAAAGVVGAGAAGSLQTLPSEAGEAGIFGNAALMLPARQLPFWRLTVAWILLVSFLCGFTIWGLEGGDVSFIDALFVAFNGVTCTGLSSVDLTRVTRSSIAVICLGIQLGSSTLLSLVPVCARLYYLYKVLPSFREGVSYNLKNYRRVPQTIVEYKSLVILLRVVLTYQVVIYLLYAALLLVYFALNDTVRHVATEGSNSSALGWVVFHTVSAYNNAGFSTMPDSMGQFVPHTFVLFCIMMLVLHGNVLLPIFVRWIVVLLNARAEKDSSRKIYFRYLLLNGRTLYTGIFGSQQTWVLLVTQVLLMAYQIAVTLAVSWGDPAFESFTPGQKVSVAWFEAIQTRHAGMTTINLGLDSGDDRGRVSPATIVTYLMMMFLAPVPFLAVLGSTMPDFTNDSMRARMRDRGNRSPMLECSRDLSLQLLAATQQRDGADGAAGGAQDGDAAADGPVTEEELLHYIDCRALLMTKYPDASVPWRERVGVRVRAVRYHLRLLAEKLWHRRLMRDMLLLWFAWFLIASAQKRHVSGIRDQIFILFELVTAYGNVGLSLGSTKPQTDPDYCGYCAYSVDLGTLGKIVLILVMVLGRTRELPMQIDGALQIRDGVTEAAMMSEAYYNNQPMEPRQGAGLPEREPLLRPVLQLDARSLRPSALTVGTSGPGTGSSIPTPMDR
eukprot:TRINITY_DN65507_c0_g1_i1.p1 TRINITY_DN65507_c0_g1~~TRINITY_DN65507_c0_g1_i1.p1  ORF type:complete len:881 (+),score=258.43 TRINITY_DN65507_c0_g1_i1:105-2645(+)